MLDNRKMSKKDAQRFAYELNQRPDRTGRWTEEYKGGKRGWIVVRTMENGQKLGMTLWGLTPA